MRLRKLALFVALWAFTAPAFASSAWITGKVLAAPAADGSGTDAPKHASLSVVRANIPSEHAVQLAGPDATDPTRIFSPDHKPAYYLTDVGSQWYSGITTGQGILAIVEVMAPDHGWSGRSYAGAVNSSVTKPQLVSGLVSMPDLWLSLLPVPTLAGADPSHIALSITAFSSLAAPVDSLALWRRPAGSLAWGWQATIPNPSSSVTWDDLSVAPGNLYEYGISVNYSWSGGGGAGELSGTAGIYSTHAKGIGGPFAASLNQPTPRPTAAAATAIPTPFDLPAGGWLAYPNPVSGDDLKIAFDARGEGSYEVTAYTVTGELARSLRGSIEKAGRVSTQMTIHGLAAGIYLVRLTIEAKDGSKQEMPLRKVAIVR